MVSRSPRPKSNGSTVTAGSGAMRPTSRQSTASTQSNGTQPSHPPQHVEDPYPMPAQMPSALWQQHQDTMGQNTMGPQQAGNHAFMGATTMQHHHTSMSFSNDNFQNAPAMSIEMSGQYDSMNGGDSQFDFSLDNGMQEEHMAEGTKKKKGSTSSQANDNELRRLFRENKDKSLKDVAAQVMKDDKGPKSEKTKQVFGMIWLATHAKKSNSSVPRNRVFSSYATRCGTERVPPLNPASFGKLVRIIFPGITTRRLGVRGESKYHYVELSLIDDNRPERASVPRARSMTVDSTGRESARPSLVARPSFGGDNAYFSPIDSPRPASAQAKPPSNNNNGSLYLQNPAGQDFDFRASEADMMQRPLQFQKSTAPPVPGDVQLDLPSIEPYLPQGVDIDAVDSLTSVYRSHCLLAIDNFRFCKTEKLSDSYKSLIGLLTVPGQKLLAHPQIAAWVRACDWMKYQKMIPMLDMIILTQVPKKAMAHMEHVAMNICPWISQYFQNQPRHTQDAMLEPANLFVALLERFLRVNRAALDVADVMENPELRTALWNDWVLHLKPFHVLQNSLMWNGHKRTFHILTQEARFLLSPIEENVELAGSHIFENNGSRSEFQLSEMQNENDGSSSAIIARLARFLASLVHRFPGVDARELLSYIEVTGNNISRNLTLNGAASLGNWWRIKLFIDEMSYWLAEKGGFLDTDPEAATQRQVSWTLDGGNFAISEEPMNHDMNERMPLQDKTNREKNQHFGGANTASFPQAQRGAAQGSKERTGKAVPNSMKRADQEEVGLPNDDSGIGMGIEDEFNMDSKYNTFVEGVHGSDPADVVVC